MLSGFQLDLGNGELQQQTGGRDENMVKEFNFQPPSLGGQLSWLHPLMKG